MDKFFFSEKNVARQCATLEKQLNIKDNPESRRKCKKFLVNQMKNVYDKHGKKKRSNMPVAEFIDLLNKKSVKECMKICEENRSNKKSYSGKIGELERTREEEVYGKRDIQLPRRPQYTSMNRNNVAENHGMPGYSEGAGSTFAPIAQGQGEFISATGEMGEKMIFGNLENQIYGQRGDSKDELERRMMERMNEYDDKKSGGPGMMGGMMGGAMGGAMGGMMGMPDNLNNTYMNRMPSYQGAASQNMPQLNFTLVEGKHKRNGVYDTNSSYSPNMETFGMSSGMPSVMMDMGNMGNMGMAEFEGMRPNMQNMGIPNMGMQNMGMPNMGMQNMGMQNMGMQNMGMQNMGMPNMGMQNMGMQNMGIPNMGMQNMGMQNIPPEMMQTSPELSDGELKTKLNQLLSERESLDNIRTNIQGGGFNPTISPNMNYNMGNINNMGNKMDINQMLMMQKMHEMMTNKQNRLNYNGGVNPKNDSNAMQNLDSEQLASYIHKIKDKIYYQMNLTNFDPLFLQSLDSKQLDELIKKISLDLSGLNNIVSENLKKNNLPTHTTSSEIIENQKHPDVSTLNSMINIIENDQHDLHNIIIGDDSGTNQNKQEVQPVQTQSIKYHDLLIKSRDYDDPENYGDYLVDFKEPYKNVHSFEIINMKLPRIANFINQYNNQITYILNDEEINVHINPGVYNSIELINEIKKVLTPNFNIEIDNDGKINIINSFNKSFDILNNRKSILRQLGFNKSNYIGKKDYKSESLPTIDKQLTIYLFIENVDDEHPLLKFNSNTDIRSLLPVKCNFSKPIDSLSDIFIKFKTEDDPNSEKYIDFNGESHELLVRIGTK